MKRRIAVFAGKTSVLFLTCLLFFACGSKSPPPKPEWVFKQKGIFLSYKADDMLNEFNGGGHALQLVVYQFDNINKFAELSEYKDGIIKMLKGGNVDPSVQAVKKIFVDPGSSDTLVLNRAEKSRWVGVVAGYYNLAPGRVTCFFEIPHVVEKKGMIFAKKEIATILDLKAKLDLMPQELKCRRLNE
jgi:type VI secretion system VasD/TssJ family lipoprotein